MSVSTQLKRGKRADIDSAAAKDQLLPGEPLFITDEERFAVATATNAYVSFPKSQELSDIINDNILHPQEKYAVVQEYGVISGEESGLVAQAVTHGITAEKVTYQSAVSALTTYLGTLTGWNVVPGSPVTIDGNTFRVKFSDVYVAREALKIKISEAITAAAAVRYTWVAYANNSTGSSGFTNGAWTNQTYIGIATNKTTATESSVAGDYSWSLIKGDIGATGLDGLTAVLSNESHTLPASSTGVVSSYANSGTTVTVYEGTTALTASASAVTGAFRIGTVTQLPAATITSGAVSYAGTTATLAAHSGMVAGTDSVSLTLPITVYRANGTSVLVNKVQTLTKSKAGVDGPNGTRTAVLELYRWSAAVPTTWPAGSSTYTWATGQFTDPATLNGWSATPPAAVAGQTLWITRQVFSDALVTATSSVTWAATTASAAGAAGTSGVNGSRTAFLEVYQWAASAPATFPSGTSTYTWATGAFTAPSTPAGWALVPGAPVVGQTLWACSVRLANTGTAATDAVTWNTAAAYAVGSAGTNGSTGAQGPSVVVNASRTTTFTATDGTLDAAQANIVFTATVSGVTSPTYVWTFTGFQTAPTSSGTASQTVTSAQFGTSKAATVTCTVSGTYVDVTSIVRLEKSTAAAGATVGATWGSNVGSIPANLSTAGASPAVSVLNNAISISAAGALSGAGGGAVTIGGLGYTGALNATANLLTSGLLSARPTGANGDTYFATDNLILYQKIAGVWSGTANSTTDTNQLTDGAGLGTTSTWTGVSGAGKPADNATVGANADNFTGAVGGGNSLALGSFGQTFIASKPMGWGWAGRANSTTQYLTAGPVGNGPYLTLGMGTNPLGGATRAAVLDMYRWSASAPTTFPSGSSTYTWATGQFTAPATPNGWSITPPADVSGQTLWVTRQVFGDALVTATSAVTWSAATSSSISVGVSTFRTALIEVYQWGISAPATFPSGTSTYTWATGDFSAPTTPAGWSKTPGAPVAGQILWACSVRLTNSSASLTDPVTWNTAAAYVVGNAGAMGITTSSTVHPQGGARGGFVLGRKYVISFYARNNYQGGDTCWISSPAFQSFTAVSSQALSPSWERHVFKGTCTATNAAGELTLWNNPTASIGGMSFGGVQVEEGDIPTAYSETTIGPITAENATSLVTSGALFSTQSQAGGSASYTPLSTDTSFGVSSGVLHSYSYAETFTTWFMMSITVEAYCTNLSVVRFEFTPGMGVNNLPGLDSGWEGFVLDSPVAAVQKGTLGKSGSMSFTFSRNPIGLGGGGWSTQYFRNLSLSCSVKCLNASNVLTTAGAGSFIQITTSLVVFEGRV